MDAVFKEVKKEELKPFMDDVWISYYNDLNLESKRKEAYISIESDGKRIGYMKIKFVGDVANLKDLIIEKEYRGNKIGSKAIDEFERIAKDNRCRKLRLKTCKEIMSSAYRLYINKGFTQEAVLKNDYLNKEWTILSKYIS